MRTLQNVAESVMEILLVFFFAGFGGAARVALYPPPQKPPLSWYVGRILVAYTAGLLVLRVAKYFELSDDLAYALVLVAGLWADDVMRRLTHVGSHVARNPEKAWFQAKRWLRRLRGGARDE